MKDPLGRLMRVEIPREEMGEEWRRRWRGEGLVWGERERERRRRSAYDGGGCRKEREVYDGSKEEGWVRRF